MFFLWISQEFQELIDDRQNRQTSNHVWFKKMLQSNVYEYFKHFPDKNNYFMSCKMLELSIYILLLGYSEDAPLMGIFKFTELNTQQILWYLWDVI